jgi:MbtH protein
VSSIYGHDEWTGDSWSGKMAELEDVDTQTYEVVTNDEEQCSIWLAGLPVPAGWRTVGKSGPRAECLAYIKEVWTDMRPLSLRAREAAQG